MSWASNPLCPLCEEPVRGIIDWLDNRERLIQDSDLARDSYLQLLYHLDCLHRTSNAWRYGICPCGFSAGSVMAASALRRSSKDHFRMLDMEPSTLVEHIQTYSMLAAIAE